MGISRSQPVDIPQNQAETKPDDEGAEGHLTEDTEDTVDLLTPFADLNTLNESFQVCASQWDGFDAEYGERIVPDLKEGKPDG